DRAVQARFAGTAWTRCDSWYRDERGRVIANWPGYMREYFEQTHTLRTSDYRFLGRPHAPSGAESGLAREADGGVAREADGDVARGGVAREADGGVARGGARASPQGALADA